MISSVGSGTVVKWSKTHRDSNPSASACGLLATAFAHASAAVQPSYSPFQPWGTMTPTSMTVRASRLVGRAKLDRARISRRRAYHRRHGDAPAIRPVCHGPSGPRGTLPGRRSRGTSCQPDRRWSALVDDRDDRRRARPVRADPAAARGPAPEPRVPACPALEAPGRDTPAGRLATAIGGALEKAAPVVVTGCGTSEHGAQALAAILAEAARGPDPRRRPAGQRASRRRRSRHRWPRAGRPGYRDQPRGRDRGNESPRSSGRRGRGARGRDDVQPGLADRALRDRARHGEIDLGWCHTVGYLSPILAAVAVGPALSGVPGDAEPLAVRALLEAGVAQGSAARPSPPSWPGGAS